MVGEPHQGIADSPRIVFTQRLRHGTGHHFSIYGLLLGWLRHRSRGLALPTVAHVFADAAIFAILVYAGDL
jgi:hypothetical protein